MTPGILLTVVLSSVLGSLHCAGMCGPFVAFYAGTDAARSGRNRRWIGHAAYHGGRLATYLVLGSVAGALGDGLDSLGVLSGIGRFAGLVAGSIMVAWGLLSLSFRANANSLRMPQRVRRWLVESAARMSARPPFARAALLGLSTAWLPCGWLYAFVVAAAGTANPLSGALILLALWAGSLPALLGLGFGVQAVFQRARPLVAWLNAVALIGLGVLGVAGRLDVPALALDRVHSVLDGTHPAPRGPSESCPMHGSRQ
jgi:sulfite exporter TauE/SafE